jgi:hypothetical protein
VTLSRQDVYGIGIGTALLAALALAAANFLGDGENGGVGPYVFTLAVSLVIAGALFGWAIPRIERAGRAGLIAGAFALLALPIYWSGLPYVLGPAAIVLGLLGRGRAEGRGAATVAVVLGALATAGGIAGIVLDSMS